MSVLAWLDIPSARSITGRLPILDDSIAIVQTSDALAFFSHRNSLQYHIPLNIGTPHPLRYLS